MKVRDIGALLGFATAFLGAAVLAAPPKQTPGGRTTKSVSRPRQLSPALLAARARLLGGEPKPMPEDEARTAVAILDDAYRLMLTETHAAYHTRPSVPVAATVIRRLQDKMAERGWPRSRFLGVNTIIMNPDHLPKDDFEQRLVRTLKFSDQRVDEVIDGKLRVGASLMLGSGCGSCHWTSGPGAGRAALTHSVPLVGAPVKQSEEGLR